MDIFAINEQQLQVNDEFSNFEVLTSISYHTAYTLGKSFELYGGGDPIQEV